MFKPATISILAHKMPYYAQQSDNNIPHKTYTIQFISFNIDLLDFGTVSMTDRFWLQIFHFAAYQ